MQILDVGCGHNPKGDVNIDLNHKATSHRSPNQTHIDDYDLNVKAIPNFIVASSEYLPFLDSVNESIRNQKHYTVIYKQSGFGFGIKFLYCLDYNRIIALLY